MSLHFSQLHRLSKLPQITSFQWHQIFQRECNNSAENLAFLTAYLPLSWGFINYAALECEPGSTIFLAPRDSWFFLTMSVPSQQSCRFWAVWCDWLLGGQLAKYVVVLVYWFFFSFSFPPQQGNQLLTLGITSKFRKHYNLINNLFCAIHDDLRNHANGSGLLLLKLTNKPKKGGGCYCYSGQIWSEHN